MHDCLKLIKDLSFRKIKAIRKVDDGRNSNRDNGYTGNYVGAKVENYQYCIIQSMHFICLLDRLSALHIHRWRAGCSLNNLCKQSLYYSKKIQKKNNSLLETWKEILAGFLKSRKYWTKFYFKAKHKILVLFVIV